MALGPGKYDEECTAVRLNTDAKGVVLIVLDGIHGNGFSAQLTLDMRRTLPSILRQVAAEIEGS